MMRAKIEAVANVSVIVFALVVASIFLKDRFSTRTPRQAK